MLGSRFLTAGLLAVAAGLALIVLWFEVGAYPRWSACADLMRRTFIECDAGPGDWALALTAVAAVILAAGAGAAFERARQSRDIR
jgi:hypothetical protein